MEESTSFVNLKKCTMDSGSDLIEIFDPDRYPARYFHRVFLYQLFGPDWPMSIVNSSLLSSINIGIIGI